VTPWPAGITRVSFSWNSGRIPAKRANDDGAEVNNAA
jgi:hypothetical protein